MSATRHQGMESHHHFRWGQLGLTLCRKRCISGLRWVNGGFGRRFHRVVVAALDIWMILVAGDQ